MLKALGILLISSSVSLFGAYLSCLEKQKSQKRGELLTLSQNLLISIKHSRTPIYQLLETTSLPLLNSCGFLEAAMEFPPSRDSIILSLHGLSEQEKSAAAEYFCEIGKITSAGKEYDLTLCFAEKMSLFSQKYSESEKTRAILFKKIGIIAALVLAIILL